MVSARQLEVERPETLSLSYERVPRLTPADSVALGRRARSLAPRESHSAWSAPSNRADSIALLEEEARTRLPELLPIRYGRMLASPYAFYCEATAVMAADLAGAPQSGLQVQLCGDAHVSNFGGFTSRDNGVVFDIRDFDETLPGPWEWDVKRLATSIHIAGRMRGCEDDDSRALVLTAVSAYRRAMQEFAALTFPDVVHARLDVAEVARRWGRAMQPVESSAKLRGIETLTQRVRGKSRITGTAPLAIQVEEMLPEIEQQIVEQAMSDYIERLEQGPRSNTRCPLDEFEYAGATRGVPGAGGARVRSWVVLLRGKNRRESLYLQLKECQASALEPHMGLSSHAAHGERIAEGRRLLQVETDDFLGWGRVDDIAGAAPRDYYVHQLRDWKLTLDVQHIPLRDLLLYGQLCGWILARAHACSGDRVAIAHYLGEGPAFDRAIAEFSKLYANQNARDFHALQRAVERGAVKV